MKIEIRVGDISSNKRVKYIFEKHDDINKEKERMYDFLMNCNDCIIEDVDNFLLYTLNNGLIAFLVKDNVEIEDKEYDLIPRFHPELYRVFEIKEDGTEVSLQTVRGVLEKNYFNKLMGCIMDDYYSCLNFWK